MNKYRAQRTSGFGSKLEYAVYSMLKNREQAGELTDIKCQSKVYLTDARILYIADFEATVVSSEEQIWIEAKGVETATWRLKRRLWKYYGPGALEIWKGSHVRPYLEEVIECRR